MGIKINTIIKKAETIGVTYDINNTPFPDELNVRYGNDAGEVAYLKITPSVICFPWYYREGSEGDGHDSGNITISATGVTTYDYAATQSEVGDSNRGDSNISMVISSTLTEPSQYIFSATSGSSNPTSRLEQMGYSCLYEEIAEIAPTLEMKYDAEINTDFETEPVTQWASLPNSGAAYNSTITVLDPASSSDPDIQGTMLLKISNITLGAGHDAIRMFSSLKGAKSGGSSTRSPYGEYALTKIWNFRTSLWENFDLFRSALGAYPPDVCWAQGFQDKISKDYISEGIMWINYKTVKTWHSSSYQSGNAICSIDSFKLYSGYSKPKKYY